MVNYQVLVSKEARDNLQAIYEWLVENESTATAQKVRDGLLDAIIDLATMPHKHSIVQEIQHDTIVYRRVLKWSYKIIFTIEEDAIQVLVVDVVHTKQNPQRLQDKFGS